MAGTQFIYRCQDLWVVPRVPHPLSRSDRISRVKPRSKEEVRNLWGQVLESETSLTCLVRRKAVTGKPLFR